MLDAGLGTAPVPVAQLALTLHAAGLPGDVIVARLVDAAAMAGPAGDVHYLPAGVPVPQDLSAVPVAAPGEVAIGRLVFAAAEPDAVERIRTLAAHAGVALRTLRMLAEAEQRTDTVSRIAERLQDALLPQPPDVANTFVAHEYRAAGRDARVGGDFYDVFPMPDGRVLVVVGDVMGKGVEAASRTTRITQTLRSLALTGLDLDMLLGVADEQVVFQDPDLMATVWCGLYDPATGELQFSSLGHPPALLLREGDGTPIRLELHGLPLGMRDLADETPEIRNRRLESGDLLVLYTDGVVEAAGDYLAGQDALLHAIDTRRNEPLTELVHSALDELLADVDHLDDALMLLLRRR